MMKKLLAALVLASSLLAQAQMQERIVTVENPDPTGRMSVAQLTELANRKMAEDLIVEFIGVDTFNRHKGALNAKVIQNVSKFTPFQKTMDVERGAFGARLTMQYKVSLTDFRKLLTEAGIFSKTRMASNVIAFFAMENKSGDRLAMSWKKGKGSAENTGYVYDWTSDFKRAFEKAGYSFNKNLNPAWIETFSENASPQDVLNKNTLGQSFILWGTGKIVDDPRTDEKVLVAQVKVYSQDLKREVTDSVRRFKLRDDGHQRWEAWAQDLVVQLDELDAKSLNQDSALKLTYKGAMPIMEQESFKQWLLNSTPLIKSATERRFDNKEVTYELETDSTPQALASKLNSLEYKGKKVKAQAGSSEITLETL